MEFCGRALGVGRLGLLGVGGGGVEHLHQVIGRLLNSRLTVCTLHVSASGQ